MKSLSDFDNKKEYQEYLRAYFAAMAMQGLLSGSGLREQIHIQFPNTSAEYQYAIVSVASIRIADELLKQLENQ